MSRAVLLKLGLCLVSLVFLGVLALVVAYPHVAALICPGCYGFQPVAQGIFSDKRLSAAERQYVSATLANARAKVAGFYGASEVKPRVLLCTTDKCYHRFGGGISKGRAVLDKGILLSPKGINPVIISHELSHSEVEARIGLVKAFDGSIPTWFNEGLAVVVSDDPRYLASASASAKNRCLVSSSELLPVALNDWMEKAAADRSLYAKAACRVDAWIRKKGGTAAVTHLLNQVANGESFETAYHR